MQNHFISALHLQQWHASRILPSRVALHFLSSPEHNEPARLTQSYTLYLTGTCAHTFTHIFDLTHYSHPHNKRNLRSSRQKNTLDKHFGSPTSFYSWLHATEILKPAL